MRVLTKNHSKYRKIIDSPHQNFLHMKNLFPRDILKPKSQISIIVSTHQSTVEEKHLYLTWNIKTWYDCRLKYEL
jgi:hypothetical protein